MQKSNQKAWSGAREMVEVALGLGGVTALSWWLPGSWRPSHLLFCAFFIVVFAIAVRYRALVAYSASLLAAIIFALLLWLHPEMRAQPAFLYLALEPFLLLLSGICTNDILRWQRQRLQKLEQHSTQVQAALQKTQQRYQTALQVNEALEQQVSGLPTSLATISEKILALWRSDREECYAAILDLVISAIEAQSCALYLLENGSWRLYAERSIDGSVSAPVIDTSDPLIEHVLEQCEVCTIRDSLSEKNVVTPASAVLAGPLVNQPGEVTGLVVINHIPLLKFTPGAVRLFRSLLRMASISLQMARTAISARSQDLALIEDDPDPTESALPVVSPALMASNSETTALTPIARSVLAAHADPGHWRKIESTL